MTVRTLTRNEAGEFFLDGEKLYGVGGYPEYETPDVISADSWKEVHRLLYNRYQTDESWKEWDEFHYDGKLAYLCFSFHVIQVIDRPDLLEKARQERSVLSMAPISTHYEGAQEYRLEQVSRHDRLIERLENEQTQRRYLEAS